MEGPRFGHHIFMEGRLATALDPKTIYTFNKNDIYLPTQQIFYPYNLEILLPNECKIQIGRFSHGARSVATFGTIPAAGIILTVGAFCQFNENCSILVNREHKNNSIVNYTSSILGNAFEPFTTQGQKRQMTVAFGPIVIGDNVTISDRASILSGVTVGQGCVIGAAAVVNRDCEDFGIYAGVPAKRLRDRFGRDERQTFERWRIPFVRSHCLPQLPSVIAAVAAQDDMIDTSGVEWMERQPTVVVRGEINKETKLSLLSIVGFKIGDEIISNPLTVNALQAYFAQSQNESANEVQWSPDIFHYLGVS